MKQGFGRGEAPRKITIMSLYSCNFPVGLREMPKCTLNTTKCPSNMRIRGFGGEAPEKFWHILGTVFGNLLIQKRVSSHDPALIYARKRELGGGILGGQNIESLQNLQTFFSLSKTFFFTEKKVAS